MNAALDDIWTKEKMIFLGNGQSTYPKIIFHYSKNSTITTRHTKYRSWQQQMKNAYAKEMKASTQSHTSTL